MKFLSTEHFSVTDLVDAMNAAFADYIIPMQVSAESLTGVH